LNQANSAAKCSGDSRRQQGPIQTIHKASPDMADYPRARILRRT
jgi:hypothetical protein